MSLLEDVFLEDEAGEAQELERIIEGDEYDERPRSRSDSGENSEKDDEAEEDKRRVDPANAKTKRVIRNPRFVLNPARLTGPRGMQVLPEHFKDFKFKGKGYEREDLDLLLKKLEHWAYRLYPKFKFEDCLKKIETLGKKRAVSVHLTKLRLGMITSEETVVQQDSSGDETAPAATVEEDEFDKLLQQQIDIARATPGPGSVKKTPFSDRASLMPKATSSPSINEEQRERMLLNRKKAEERRLARLKQNTLQENTINTSDNAIDDNSIRKKHNKSAIDSDDEDINDYQRSVTDKGVKNYVGNTEITDARNKVNMSVIGRDTDVLDNASNKSDNGSESITIELDKEGVVTKSIKSDAIANRLTKSRRYLDTDVTVEIDDGFVISNTYVPAKKHKSIIDSSDDDALVISEQVTIDVEKHNKTTKISRKNILDSSDDDDDDTEPITVNVEKHKTNKSNVIDRSDSEDEIAKNVSIAVDSHNNKPVDDSNVASKDSIDTSNNSNTHIGENNKVDNVSSFDNICKNKHKNTFDNLKGSEENDVIMNAVIEEKDIVSSNVMDIKNSNIDKITTQGTEKQEHVSHNSIDKNNENENPIHVLLGKAKSNDVANKVPESDVIEDIMDVDFSDDF